MTLRTIVIGLLNRIAVLRFARHGIRSKLGAHAQVFLWRVSGQAGAFEIGNSSMFSAHVVFEKPHATLTIGDRSFVGGKSMFSICESVSIGSDVMMSWGCTIADHDSHSLDFRYRAHDVENWLAGRKDWTNVRKAPVIISDKVWIGFNCSVLKGVTVGEGAVVAANSNVTRDVQPWTLVAGNPARVIRQLDPA